MSPFSFWILLSAILCATLQPSSAICPKACPHIMDPVCGTDGRSFTWFSNGCLMRAHNECERNGEKPLREVDLSNCEDPGWE
ncbi:enhancer of split M1 protein [Toxorhynchites rutilus septentrionalis]|uniref:enhancer of split M1 protein n=1 Tax=Toxorhynchites rutilus septentrionalis TaxID=329112 RepID=UPI002479309E|nr:enhancer of split M1 protein [Toxorhynchites rutilus septentrionalis]